MTQQELALKIRVGTQTIDKYESGMQTPDTQTILKISTVLDIPASELLEQATHGQIIDAELEQLISEVGTKKAKFILRKAKELGDDDFLRVAQMLDHIKYNQN